MTVNKKWKIGMTAVLIVLLFLIYVMIFNFSAEDATASSGVSQKVTSWRILQNICW